MLATPFYHTFTRFIWSAQQYLVNRPQYLGLPS
nr:MAG TPA: hypothetical protein [Caudoviricetes sp.]